MINSKDLIEILESGDPNAEFTLGFVDNGKTLTARLSASQLIQMVGKSDSTRAVFKINGVNYVVSDAYGGDKKHLVLEKKR